MLKCKDAKAKLVRTPNHGRDIVPFLALKEELKNMILLVIFIQSAP